MSAVELSVIRDILIIFYVTVGIPTMIWKTAKYKGDKKDE